MANHRCKKFYNVVMDMTVIYSSVYCLELLVCFPRENFSNNLSIFSFVKKNTIAVVP